MPRLSDDEELKKPNWCKNDCFCYHKKQFKELEGASIRVRRTFFKDHCHNCSMAQQFFKSDIDEFEVKDGWWKLI